MVPRAVGFRIVWPEGVIFGSIMTYHVQFLLLVRQPLFDRAALPLTQTSWVLPPLSVGKMTLRLYGALNYSHGLSKGPSFGTGRGTTRSFSSTLLRRWPGSDRVQNLHRGEHEFAGLQLPWLSARQFAIFFFLRSTGCGCRRESSVHSYGSWSYRSKVSRRLPSNLNIDSDVERGSAVGQGTHGDSVDT